MALPFVSHLVDLRTGENASPAYQRIHPKGLVPAFAIDGDLIIESVDILEEIGLRFHAGSHLPLAMDNQPGFEALRTRANNAQPHLKLRTFEFLFRAMPSPIGTSDRILRNHPNDQIKAFHLKFLDGFARDQIEESVDRSHSDFLHLDRIPSDGRHFLCGEKFTLADTAWMPNVHRFEMMGWLTEHFMFLQPWFLRVKSWPFFKEGLSDWEPEGFAATVADKKRERRILGETIDSFGESASETTGTKAAHI